MLQNQKANKFVLLVANCFTYKYGKMRKKVSQLQPKKTHTAKRLSQSGKGKAKPRSRPPRPDPSEPKDFLDRRHGTSDENIDSSTSPSSDASALDNVTQRSRKNRNSTLNETQNASTSRRKQAKPKKRKNHVLKEIRRLQLTTNLLLARAPFQR